MLVVDGVVRMMMIAAGPGIVMVAMMRSAFVSEAERYLARQRVGEMRMVMRVIDAIHERDIGLTGQHCGDRHAKHSDQTS